jgi:EcsC protein family
MRKVSPKAAQKFEAKQIARIHKWRLRRLGWMPRLTGVVTAPVVLALRAIIPHSAVEATLHGNIVVARGWARERATLRSLGATSFGELAEIELLQVDRAVRKVQSRATWMGAGVGVVSGFFGIFALPIGMAATLNLALRTIHRVGLCYGYAAPTEGEHLFVYYTLSLAGYRGPEDKAVSLDAMRDLQAKTALPPPAVTEPPAAGEPLDDSTRHHAFAIAHHDFSREITKQLVTVRLLTAIPGIGAIVGLIVDTSYMRSVGRAARHAYQVRWLRDRGRWME